MRPVALVTGGRQGLGSGIALALAEAGFDLIILDVVEDDAAQATMQQLAKLGAAAHFILADIADIERAGAVTDSAFSAFGHLEVLVNNAGVQARVHEYGDVLDTTAESFDRVLGINLRGTFFLTQAIARRMIAVESVEHFRAIVTVSSVAAEIARTSTPEYNISKTGLSMLNRIFALRLAVYGIACFEIRPGMMQTAMTERNYERLTPIIEEGLTPIARWGQPADVGRAVAAVASGAVPFSTGDALRVDGGMHIPSSPLDRPYAAKLFRPASDLALDSPVDHFSGDVMGTTDRI